MTRAERLGLEPAALSRHWEVKEGSSEQQDAFEGEVATSIAISLKRIADAVDGTALGVDISESLAAISHVFIYGRNQ